MYEPRTYREWIKAGDLVSFSIVMKETDLHIRAHSNLEFEAKTSIRRHRQPIENYIREHPLFYSTLEPVDIEEDAPPIIREMAEAGRKAHVGPMAAVAGAIAEAVGRDLLTHSSEVIIENGGDIFLKITRKRRVGIYAGAKSPFTGKLSMAIEPVDTPLGICTSSGTVGHSLSMGVADAVIVQAQSTALADAMATSIGNQIRQSEDIGLVIERAGAYHGIAGLVIIKDDRIGLWGNIKIESL